MKEIIGLLVFLCIFIFTMFMTVKKHIELKFTIVFLAFAMLSGFAITNYDIIIIKRFKWGSLEVEMAKKEITEAKESALNDIRNIVQAHEKKLEELNNSTKKTKDEIEMLNRASSLIALKFIRTAYFTLSTKLDLGGVRDDKAIEEIEKDINEILPLIIQDDKKRNQWLKDLKNALPKRN